MEKILFLYKQMKIGGAEKVILDTAKVLNSKNINTVIATANTIDLEVYKKNNLKLYDLPFNKIGPIDAFKCIRGLIDICKKENITIIHSHHRLTTVYALIVGKILNIKVVHTEHNVFPDKNSVNLRGKNIIAVSKMVKDSLVLHKVKENDIKVIYNGIDLEECKVKKDLKEELGIDKSIFCFGVIARLNREKGIDFLIKTYSELTTDVDSKIIVMGEGPLREELEALVKSYNLESKVVFTGQRSDIKEIIPSLDCYILPSIYEGFPVTNLEIMVNRKVVIATNVGGNSEIINNKVNGFLIESQNKDELREAMTYVLENQSILKGMGEEAFKTIKNNFDLDKVGNEYIKYYSSIK